jgi:hypothetical protein
VLGSTTASPQVLQGVALYEQYCSACQSDAILALDVKTGRMTLGQKSGVAWGLDPVKEGAILWQRRVGKGPRARFGAR